MLIDLEGSTGQGFGMNTQARLPRFKYRLSYSQALGPRASYFTFLCLSLPISEVRIIIATSSQSPWEDLKHLIQQLAHRKNSTGTSYHCY